MSHTKTQHCQVDILSGGAIFSGHHTFKIDTSVLMHLNSTKLLVYLAGILQSPLHEPKTRLHIDQILYLYLTNPNQTLLYMSWETPTDEVYVLL